MEHKIDIYDDFASQYADLVVAREKAGIENDYKLKFYPKQKNFFAQWLQGMEENSRIKMLKEELGQEGYAAYQEIKKVQLLQGTQARMPFEFQWK